MADDYRGFPKREIKEESEYPPPPGEEEDRRSYPPPSNMATGVTLPSFSSAYGASPPAGRYPPDPRGSRDYPGSPASGASYPPPPAAHGREQERIYLPPVQGHPGAPGQGPPAPYGADQRGYYPGPERRQFAEPQYGSDPAFAQYPGYQPGGQPGPQYAYPVGAGAAQAAPRQRTSIACRYCRKRKIRCSGYQNTPDGKCTNCKKTGNECVFQPVSSSSSTAFVPVSAVPGGVPPGTQLFGAFGQPLSQQGGPGPGPPSQASYPPPPQSEYPLPSPTGSYYQHPDDRAQPGSRRSRPIDEEQASRLPPPNPYMEEDPRDPRRRSPASMQSSTPPHGMPAYSREYDERRRNSPSGSSNAGSSNRMRMENLLGPSEGREMDQNMLGRLNQGRWEQPEVDPAMLQRMQMLAQHVNPQQADTQQVDTQQADTQQANPQQADTEQADTEQADTQQADTQQTMPSRPKPNARRDE